MMTQRFKASNEPEEYRQISNTACSISQNELNRPD